MEREPCLTIEPRALSLYAMSDTMEQALITTIKNNGRQKSITDFFPKICSDKVTITANAAEVSMETVVHM
jgi:hypothetical protein